MISEEKEERKTMKVSEKKRKKRKQTKNKSPACIYLLSYLKNNGSGAHDGSAGKGTWYLLLCFFSGEGET